MRTTVELPDELLKRAKVEAVLRGVTLKDLLGAALERELGRALSGDQPPPRRLVFPLLPSRAPGSLVLTNADIAHDEDEEDARRHGVPR